MEAYAAFLRRNIANAPLPMSNSSKVLGSGTAEARRGTGGDSADLQGVLLDRRGGYVGIT